MALGRARRGVGTRQVGREAVDSGAQPRPERSGPRPPSSRVVFAFASWLALHVRGGASGPLQAAGLSWSLLLSGWRLLSAWRPHFGRSLTTPGAAP